MAHIKIKKGLNIPLNGASRENKGSIQSSSAALDFTPFSPTIHPHLLTQVGDTVTIGQPLIEEKGGAKRIWTSPASGIVKAIQRGEKRTLESIIIETNGLNAHHPLAVLDPTQPISYLFETGLFRHLWMRPYNLPIHPQLKPRSIFVKAIESAPFCPPAELQLEGNESYFQTGLNLLSSIVPGQLHLVTHTSAKIFQTFQNARIHTAEGPHPISHSSLHIQLIDPILSANDIVWTVDTCGVIAIGRAIETGVAHSKKIISLAGEGILSEQRGFYQVDEGICLKAILANKVTNAPARYISGDPLMGVRKTIDDHLGFGHTVVCAIPETTKKGILHFLRFKSPTYTATDTYFQNKTESISTRLHGEPRAFIDPNIYDRVMPLQIPTVPLIKSILAEDFETAETLGLLEIAPEDFALPTFLCPSKIEMVDIVRKGLHKVAGENLSM